MTVEMQRRLRRVEGDFIFLALLEEKGLR